MFFARPHRRAWSAGYHRPMVCHHSAPPVLRWRYYSAFFPPWQLAALGRRRKMCYTAGEVKKMRTPEQVREILRALAQAYPAECSLQYQKDYELLFAVRLAAQCTDERVNQITPALFARFPTLEAFADAEPEDVEPYVRSCGFFRAQKRGTSCCAHASSSQNTAAACRTRWRRSPPLPGVGRKTANLILGDVYHKPAVVVDTHCIRLSNRMGLVDGSRTPSRSRPRCAKSCRRRNRPTFATGSSCTAAPCAPRASRYAARAACATYVKPQRRWSYETDRTHPQRFFHQIRHPTSERYRRKPAGRDRLCAGIPQP